MRDFELKILRLQAQIDRLSDGILTTLNSQLVKVQSSLSNLSQYANGNIINTQNQNSNIDFISNSLATLLTLLAVKGSGCSLNQSLVAGVNLTTTSNSVGGFILQSGRSSVNISISNVIDASQFSSSTQFKNISGINLTVLVSINILIYSNGAGTGWLSLGNNNSSSFWNSQADPMQFKIVSIANEMPLAYTRTIIMKPSDSLIIYMNQTAGQSGLVMGLDVGFQNVSLTII